MLPYELSENRCSLQAGVLRPGISLILGFSSTKPHTMTYIKWGLTSVLNKKSYDYSTFKENATKDGIDLTILRDLAEEILGESTDDPHKWIEAFMLQYNIEAAKILHEQKHGILRKHLGKDETKWTQYIELNKDLAVLASHAAVYCSVDDPSPKHIGIGSIYCHATSPIRRYCDLVNQRIIKAFIKGETYTKTDLFLIAWLNKRQKDSKKYERDLFFLQNLDKGLINGIILSEKKVWISEWKRIITWPSTCAPGSHVTLDYFVNPNIRHWKERIVFRQVDISKV
jgi:exoribonuclease R